MPCCYLARTFPSYALIRLSGTRHASHPLAEERRRKAQATIDIHNDLLGDERAQHLGAGPPRIGAGCQCPQESPLLDTQVRPIATPEVLARPLEDHLLCSKDVR